MKINVNAELSGEEIVQLFIKQAKESNLDIIPNNVKILIKSKDNKDVEISSDRLKVVYSNT